MRISKIRNNFNLAAKTYNHAAIAQKTAATCLVHALNQHYPNISPKVILDLGCGTGFMTEALLQVYPDSNFILNDLAEAMLSQCQNKFIQHPFSYLEGDMDQINFPLVDLITSNFSLQWSANIKLCIQRLYQSSQTLAFNCLVEGSLQAWQDKFPNQVLMHYPKEDELKQVIYELAPKALIFTRKFALKSPSPVAFIQQLKQIGATTALEPTSVPHLKQVLKSNTPIETEYHVLFAILEHSQ